MREVSTIMDGRVKYGVVVVKHVFPILYLQNAYKFHEYVIGFGPGKTGTKGLCLVG